ncbi:Uncharacterised protein [Actinobacillus pleuropneumoniae]|nr:Uncharacterised protein [Actinobacillus pleuropneumoniae]
MKRWKRWMVWRPWSSSRNGEPDLVLTELNLHGIDGLPFIHHIQQLDVKEPPKIVVLTEKRVEQTHQPMFPKRGR